VRHFILHVRRASRGSVRPLNCGVRRHGHVNTYTKYLTLKSAMEDLFGSEAWYALKESNHLGTWRKYARRTLRAVEVAVKDTVQVYDEEWLREVCECLERGNKAIGTAATIDDVVGVIAGTLVEVSFLQIGFMPRRKGRARKYPVRKGEWKFDGFRSVAYLQTNEQREAQSGASNRSGSVSTIS
jgi:hypothetical protein